MKTPLLVSLCVTYVLLFIASVANTEEDPVVPARVATYGNSARSTDAADSKPEFPSNSTANQTPALAKNAPWPHYATDLPWPISLNAEKRSRLTNLSRMAFIGGKPEEQVPRNPPREVTLPPLLGQVPDEVTYDDFQRFIERENPNLNKNEYGNIALLYKTHGDNLGIRWDFAIFQMLLETDRLKFSNAPDRVHGYQNNFAGLGATREILKQDAIVPKGLPNAGKTITADGVKVVPGEYFASVSDGVLAHIQHLATYAGVQIPDDRLIAHRTKSRRAGKNWYGLAAAGDSIRNESTIQLRNGPISFRDLGSRWAADDAYARKISLIASRFYVVYKTKKINPAFKDKLLLDKEVELKVKVYTGESYVSVFHIENKTSEEYLRKNSDLTDDTAKSLADAFAHLLHTEVRYELWVAHRVGTGRYEGTGRVITEKIGGKSASGKYAKPYSITWIGQPVAKNGGYDVSIPALNTKGSPPYPIFTFRRETSNKR